MSSRNLLRRVNPLVLAAVLLLTAAPVHALPLDGPAAIPGIVARLWEAFHGLLAGLWEEEGMLIDPNGANGNLGSSGAPSGASATGDAGMLIDPNG